MESGGNGVVARAVAALIRPRNLALIACVLIAGWLVFVPLAALFYTAFTEDTGFGPGPASLLEFRRRPIRAGTSCGCSAIR